MQWKTLSGLILGTTTTIITVPLDFTSWCFWTWRWRRNSVVCYFVLLVGHITFLHILGSSTVWRAEPVLNLLVRPESGKPSNGEGGRRLTWSCFPDTQGGTTYPSRKVVILQCQEDQAQFLISEGISWSYNAFRDYSQVWVTPAASVPTPRLVRSQTRLHCAIYTYSAFGSA